MLIKLPNFTIPLILRKSDGGYGYDSTDMAAIRYRLFDLKVCDAHLSPLSSLTHPNLSLQPLFTLILTLTFNQIVFSSIIFNMHASICLFFY